MMRTTGLFLILMIACFKLHAQWVNTGDNYTTGRLGIGAPVSWAPITINSISNTLGNMGVSIAFEGGNYNEIGYRFEANGANYYQVLYNGNAINWKHYESGSYITKLSLTNSGRLGVGTNNPTAELEVKSIVDDNAEIHINSSTGGKVSIIRFQDAGSTTWGLLSNYPGIDKFSIYNYHNNSSAMVFDVDGNVGIGTSYPDAKLAVKGNIHAQEVKIDLNGIAAPDYVFKEGYDLKTLDELRAHIAKEGHLPNVPSAKEMESNGINLKEMNLKLLEKIEELTLYILEQDKKIKTQDASINRLKNTNEKLELIQKRLEHIEATINIKAHECK